MVNGYNYDTRQKKGVKNIRQAAGSEQKVVTIYRKWRDFYVRYCIWTDPFSYINELFFVN